MRILFLIVISSIYTYPQALTYTNAFVFGAFDGTKEGMKFEDKYSAVRRDNERSDRYNRAWHSWQFASTISGITLGFNIALDSYEEDEGINWTNVIVTSITSGVISYNTRDVFMNVTRGREMFAPSTGNFSGIEQINNYRIPIALVLLAVNLIYYKVF